VNQPIYFNEFDSYPADWLRNLFPRATVDPRSIVDLQPSDVSGYARSHFFAGIGGWELALKLAGWPDDRPVWTGSCPCQPFSAAGKQKGEADERHLWPEFRRLIAECRPPVVFGEQVASRLGRDWLAGVRADLEALGYAVGAADLCAAGVGAPHLRQRLYWVAERLDDAAGARRDGSESRAEGEARDEARVRLSGEGRGDGRVAHTDGGLPGDGGLQPGREHGLKSEDGGAVPSYCRWFGVCHDPNRCDGSGCRLGTRAPEGCHWDDDDGWVADPLSAGRAEGWAEPGDGSVAGSGASGGLGDPDNAGPQGLGRSNELHDPIGRQAEERHTRSADGWAGSVWLQCLDGKARRVEPGIFPLAHGVPGRVGRLRAYGNAIVPQVAAAFVRAYMETSR
jgi:DNA (cytosine-5)-methyltransferase 1